MTLQLLLFIFTEFSPFSCCCLFLLNSVDDSKFSYVYYCRICYLFVLYFTQLGCMFCRLILRNEVIFLIL